MRLIRAETGRSLEDVGRSLCSRYPWTLRDAAWFALTGEPPEVHPLKIRRYTDHGMRAIDYAPWISEKTIRRAYQSLQYEDNQPIRQKGLSAFRFVEEHTEPGQAPKWDELTKRWNQRHPGDTFWDRSALRRAHQRAEQRLASAWIEDPGDPTDEEDIFEPDDQF